MLKIEPNLQLKIAWIQIDDISVTQDNAGFVRLEECAAAYREKFYGQPIAQIPDVHHARRLFHAIGIDPTKRRPSSEALLNRAIKEKGFFSVNTLVDTGNWCSLDFLLPVGIYDTAKINGDIILRKGLAADVYLALNDTELNLEGRYVLVDELGAFGSPITDSQRTATDEKTTCTLLIIWAPADYDQQILLAHARTFANRVIDVCHGNVATMDFFFLVGR